MYGSGEFDISDDPLKICVFGANRKMPLPDDPSDLIQQSRLHAEISFSVITETNTAQTILEKL
jgi:hypothetical protein